LRSRLRRLRSAVVSAMVVGFLYGSRRAVQVLSLVHSPSFRRRAGRASANLCTYVNIKPFENHPHEPKNDRCLLPSRLVRLTIFTMAHNSKQQDKRILYKSLSIPKINSKTKKFHHDFESTPKQSPF
jgi:hypothetical protein